MDIAHITLSLVLIAVLARGRVLKRRLVAVETETGVNKNSFFWREVERWQAEREQHVTGKLLNRCRNRSAN